MILKRKWPEPSDADIRKYSRILVIDDQDFPYKKLFDRDGYIVEKRNDVKRTSDIDAYQYSIILLDLQGVGVSLSPQGGLAVLQYLKERNPAQLVVAYSSAAFTLDNQQFFNMADQVLSKSADYFEFKNTVDDLLRLRWTLGYYMSVAYREIDPAIISRGGVERRIRRAILSGRPDHAEKIFASAPQKDRQSIDRTLAIIQTAASVIQTVVS